MHGNRIQGLGYSTLQADLSIEIAIGVLYRPSGNIQRLILHDTGGSPSQLIKGWRIIQQRLDGGANTLRLCIAIQIGLGFHIAAASGNGDDFAGLIV